MPEYGNFASIFEQRDFFIHNTCCTILFLRQECRAISSLALCSVPTRGTHLRLTLQYFALKTKTREPWSEMNWQRRSTEVWELASQNRFVPSSTYLYRHFYQDKAQSLNYCWARSPLQSSSFQSSTDTANHQNYTDLREKEMIITSL